MTVNEYLMIANSQIADEVDRKNYGDCEVIFYKTEVKIKLPDGNIRTYNSQLGK